MLQYVWLTIAFPLVGALVNGLFGQRMSKKASGTLGSAMVFLSFLTALASYFSYKSWAAGSDSPYFELTLWPWIHVGQLQIDAALLIDPLSTTMMLLITGVGFLIHLYSTGYMSHDKGYSRFFVYLNLFIAMMLILVLGNNLALMFVGWEGVGLCSYLLIGFWYQDMYNAKCGMKAFVVNRIGDFGVLLGAFILFWNFNTLSFTELFGNFSSVMNSATIESWVPLAAALLLFLGATGKSAQLPLHIWLPDAMAGPTPVSALIHAATMVTAGVYMVCRLNPVFTAAPTAGFIIACVGAATAFIAATIALTQNDIKKVLAYSTVSQLGFMFLACGVGAYWVAMFHVLTHAFFKACLFLGSGSVIHAMHEEQDTRVMGGLAKYMPLTYWTFLISTLAIAGIVPLSGFFSKDEILWRVATWQTQFGSAPMILWFVAIATAFMTAFYMGRVFFKTFLGKPRWTKHYVEHHHHPHESPRSMTFPLVVLATLAAIGGFMGLPHFTHAPNFLEPWLAASTGGEEQLNIVGRIGLEEHGSAAHDDHGTAAHDDHGAAAGHAEDAAAHHEAFVSFGSTETTEIIFALVSVALAAFALLGLAMPLYTKRFGATEKLHTSLGPLYRLSLNKWYIDELYHYLIVIPGTALAYGCWRVFDMKFIDGIVNGVGNVLGWLGHGVRPFQTGFVRNYAMYLLLGAVVYLALSLLK
ncbi:NADH-quinone oxidoreductase subunit L [bacterium]|nr:NADH-quinone oxidoreductase subunit L [bacterium]